MTVLRLAAVSFLLVPAVPSLAQSAVRTQPAVKAAALPAASAQPTSLPIRRVALYKNGVGFFEHIGQVHGNESVTIDFTTAQLNDVLQTLTAVDLGGGNIAGAGYNSTTPVDQQLKALPLNLGSDPSAADFYGAIRGARVEVTGAGAAMQGRILNVELRQVAAAKDGDGNATPVQKHYLTVVSDLGEVRTVELNERTGVRLLDAALHADVKRYLQTLADNRREGLRHLTLSDNGTGARELRVSYISEVPVWKSTYRILFDHRDGAGQKQATIQGWAVVDNTVGVDWNNVQLSLIAGAPQSFIQPISQPYYTRRPELDLPEEAQLQPQTHESGENFDMDTRGRGVPAKIASPSPAGVAGRGFGSGNGNGLGPGSGGNAGGGVYRIGTGSVSAPPPPISYEDSATASIQAKTTTGGFDDFFEYKLNEPVTIAKNQSALVPILQVKVEVDPVTLYNVRDHSALRALWIKNTSNLTLDRGSFSVLESGNFSGQGLLDPIHPNERRLLSYAADTAVRVSAEGEHETRRLQQMSIAKGILKQQVREVAEVNYLVHNSAADARTVVVEVARRKGWELESDLKPEESTPDVYRFRVNTQPGESARLHVGQRHTLSTYYNVGTSSEEQIVTMLKADGNPANVIAALQPVFDAKRKLAAVDAQIAADENEINTIGNDQKRLRENLGALKGSTEERALVKRYTDELNQQEDRLAAIKADLAKLHTERDAARQAAEQAVERLNVTADLS